MKIFKFSVIFLIITFCVGFVITAAMLIKQNMVDVMTNDSVITMSHNIKYKDPVTIKNMPLISQKINSGYVCIQMMSQYLNGSNSPKPTITEAVISEENNGRISTSTSGGFYGEIRKQFPDYNITRYKNIKNSELLDKIYESISNKMPVVVSYAALEKEKKPSKPETAAVAATAAINQASGNSPKWSIQYGIVVGIDLPNDKIIVNNSYGNIETFTVSDFLKATRFESYENMEFYLKLGFAIELFTKNTIYIFEPAAAEEK